MQNNEKNSNDVETQTRLKEQEVINRCYILWNHWNKRERKTETKIIIFDKPHKKKPFHKQKPREVLTEKQLEEKYGIRIR